jgi:hypothetical protein
MWGLVPGEAEPGYLCAARSTDVDHIERGKGHHDANLRGLCHPHHKIKSDREGALAAGAEAKRRAALKLRPREPHPGLKAAV